MPGTENQGFVKPLGLAREFRRRFLLAAAVRAE
jgi:hypothetical protein